MLNTTGLPILKSEKSAILAIVYLCDHLTTSIADQVLKSKALHIYGSSPRICAYMKNIHAVNASVHGIIRRAKW